MTVLVGTISASTAAAAFETLRIPSRVPAKMAARDARLDAERQQRRDRNEDLDEASSAIQSTDVALDLMTKGHQQPQANLRQAQQSYEDV